MSEELKVEQPTDQDPVKKQEEQTKTFTQEDLDKIVADRLSREKKKYEKFADYDDIKTKLSEFEKAEKDRQDSELTELQRLQKQLEEKDGTAQSLTKQLEDLQTQMQRERIVNAFIKAAPGVNIPADRIDAALKLADLSAVTVGEKGVEGLEDVMKTLVEQYSFLAEVKKPQKPIGDATNSHKDTADKTSEQLLREAAEKARRTQRMEDKIAYAALKAELNK